MTSRKMKYFINWIYVFMLKPEFSGQKIISHNLLKIKEILNIRSWIEINSIISQDAITR